MVLIELADSAPLLFKPVLPNLLSVMVNIAKDKTFEDRTRQTALELLLTLAEAKTSMVRKQENFASDIIPVAMEMLTDIEDDESWYTTDDVSIGKDKKKQMRKKMLINVLYSSMKMITRRTMLLVKAPWIELLVPLVARALFLSLSNIFLKCFNLVNGNNVVVL